MRLCLEGTFVMCCKAYPLLSCSLGKLEDSLEVTLIKTSGLRFGSLISRRCCCNRSMRNTITGTNHS
jgi:hypothetical protein